MVSRVGESETQKNMRKESSCLSSHDACSAVGTYMSVMLMFMDYTSSRGHRQRSAVVGLRRWLDNKW
jgi:hypothetical protein